MGIPDSWNPGGPPSDGTFVHATRLVVGLADLAVQAAASAGGVPPRERPTTAAAATDAAVGLALDLQRRLSAVLAGATGPAVPWTRAAVRGLVPSGVFDAVGRRVAHWSGRGAAERLRARSEARSRARTLVGGLAAAVLDEIDLDGVADRLDVDRIASRLDVDAVLSRVDLVTYTELVLEELDIGRVVRDTGGSITAETLDAFREQNARADRLVQRIADRLLHRAGTGPTDRLVAGPATRAEASAS